MNIAVIFAGGTGRRMQTKDKPKQFLMVHGKPIIIHTIEIFQNHPQIDGIVVSCIADWIDYMKELAFRYRLDKIGSIVPGGKTGQLSIYNGLKAAEETYGRYNNTVLIHDAVRPLIDEEVISNNIAAVNAFGSAITCAPAQETHVTVDDSGLVSNILDRSSSRIAKAPQSFRLNDVLEVQERALEEGYTDVIDTCTLMKMYNRELHIVPSSNMNIKITTPADFYIFRALYDARENQQISDI